MYVGPRHYSKLQLLVFSLWYKYNIRRTSYIFVFIKCGVSKYPTLGATRRNFIPSVCLVSFSQFSAIRVSKELPTYVIS